MTFNHYNNILNFCSVHTVNPQTYKEGGGGRGEGGGGRCHTLHRVFDIFEKTIYFKVAEHSFHRDFPNTIQRAHTHCIKTHMASLQRHFICSMSALSVLFSFANEHNVLMVLLFYYKVMLEKVTMKRTQQFSANVCYRKNPVKRSACVVRRKN